MKITKRQLQKIIKEEIEAIVDYSDKLKKIRANLEAAILAAYPGAKIWVSALEENGRDPEYPDDPPGGEIRVAWEGDDVIDAAGPDDQAAARGGD